MLDAKITGIIRSLEGKLDTTLSNDGYELLSGLFTDNIVEEGVSIAKTEASMEELFVCALSLAHKVQPINRKLLVESMMKKYCTVPPFCGREMGAFLEKLRQEGEAPDIEQQ